MNEELQRYAADQAMFKAAPIRQRLGDSKDPTVFLLWATPDPLGAVAAMSRMYKGIPTYSLKDIKDDERQEYWEAMHKTHLQAPLEAIKFHFFIEGVDRAFTHQMVRQRTAVYAQESLRFAVKEGFATEALVPPSLVAAGDASEEYQLFMHTLDAIEAAYMALIDHGVPAEDARALLPHCVATRLNYITDLRNLIEHAGNRLCTQAQFIWRAVFTSLVTSIRTYHYPSGPLSAFHAAYDNDWQFKLIAEDDFFKPVCFRLRYCPFVASFDRQCVIRERVQAGQWDLIHDSEWMHDPTAARRDS